MLSQYVPMLWLFVLATTVAFGILVVKSVTGPKVNTKSKQTPYESGSKPVGSTRTRFSVKFYLVAITFIVFDVEAVFVIPWAVIFKDYFVGTPNALVGLGIMMVFLSILTLGLAYEWKSGGLEWD